MALAMAKYYFIEQKRQTKALINEKDGSGYVSEKEIFNVMEATCVINARYS